jgi:hypothetical protein
MKIILQSALLLLSWPALGQATVQVPVQTGTTGSKTPVPIIAKVNSNGKINFTLTPANIPALAVAISQPAPIAVTPGPPQTFTCNFSSANVITSVVNGVTTTTYNNVVCTVTTPKVTP